MNIDTSKSNVVFLSADAAITTSTTVNDTIDVSQPLQGEEDEEPLHSITTSNLMMDPHQYYVLVEFAVRHLDFQIPELISVLHMHQIRVIHYNNRDNDSSTMKPNHDTATVGGDSRRCCTLIPLPNDTRYPSHPYKTYSKPSAITSSTTTTTTTTTPPITADMGQRHERDGQDNTSTRPFVILSMDYDSPLVPLDAKDNDPSHSSKDGMDIASIILSRCTLVRSVIELWGMATSIPECADLTQRQCGIPTNDTATTTTTTNTTTTTSTAHMNHNNTNSTTLPTTNPSRSTPGRNVVRNTLYHIHSVPAKRWKMTIHTLGSTYTRNEQEEMRLTFTNAIPLYGTVQMKDPDNEFVVVREIELDPNGGPKLQSTLRPTRPHPIHNDSGDSNTAFEENKNDTESNADHRNQIDNTDTTDNHHNHHNNCHGQYPSIACYFGRALGGCRSTRRMGGNIPKYDLKQRNYLGPTSMDAELSFIMTNLGQVQKGQCVFDPFVGTGSILLSCAIRGAYCVGTDIDIRVLRGRSQEENIFSNFQQFHLPRPELIRSDNGIYHRHFRPSHPPMYNAIVCDPPYGIRAGARKSGSKRDYVTEVLPEHRHDHIAQTQTYAVSDVLADLLDVASRTLVMGGWLVYVIPSFATSFDVDVDLPQHPCLELVHVCYQPLSSELGRRIVAMQKTREYDETKRDEYKQAAWKNGPESAEKCANIRAKILEMAKTKPRYTERAAVRKEKRRIHREEKKMTKQKLQNEPS